MIVEFIAVFIVSSAVPAPPPKIEGDEIKPIPIQTQEPILLISSGRVAPGPDHGPDPHNEVHDYGLPAYPNDPYAGTQPSDPYGGTQGWYQNPYGGTVPY